MSAKSFVFFRIRTFALLVAAIVAVGVVLAPMGYFGPLSSRIRGLFVKHTKTGNPLVDSVAEHQPANAGMYRSHLNLPLDFVLPGMLICLFKRNNASYFLGVYGWIAYHFSLKMSRLLLICGPIVAIICAICLGTVLDFILEPFLLILGKTYADDNAVDDKKNGAKKNGAVDDKKGKKTSTTKKNGAKGSEEVGLEEWDEEYRPGGVAQIKRKAKAALFKLVPEDGWNSVSSAKQQWRRSTASHGGRILLSLALIVYLLFISNASVATARFLSYCDSTAQQMSSPTILKMTRDGKIIDDALQGYKWMAKETPKDSRFFAWWDYGYQITGIGQRTSLADGNTWNHEHIATLGRLLSGSQRSSHSVIRHLADYVLIMTGAVNDDLSISTHFARIGNSVFPDHCGDADPNCNKYTFMGGDRNQPSPMMKKSLVYQLYTHGTHVGKADPRLFELVWTSARDQMRIFKVVNVSQESRSWVADPANLICDAPGSWYCVGQYPPAIKKFLNLRRSFAQVEDFNKKGQKSAYTKMIEKQGGGGEL